MKPGCRHHTPPAQGGAGALFSPVQGGLSQRNPPEEQTSATSFPRLELTPPTLGGRRPSWRDRLSLMPPGSGLQLDPELWRLRLGLMPFSVFNLYDLFRLPVPVTPRSPVMTPPQGIPGSATRGSGSAQSQAPQSGAPAGRTRQAPGAEPTTREATVGDVLRAVMATEMMRRLSDQALDRIRRDWNSLSVGEQILVGGHLSLIVGMTGVGMYFSSDESRRLLFRGIGALPPIPIPETSFTIQLRTTDTGISGFVLGYRGRLPF
ncbi:MAG: hypothetical protein SFV22_04340 [Saprospiraceae bacterium]|nr:hypothetical protein [Saprospiraceae bacterium]